MYRICLVYLVPYTHPARLRGLTGTVVAYRSIAPGFKPGRAMSEGCFIFHLALLPLEVALFI